MARRKLGAHHVTHLTLPGRPAEPGEDLMLHHWREAYELSGLSYCALRALLECEARNLSVPPWLRRFLAMGVRRHLVSGANLNQSIGTAGTRGGGRRHGKKEYDRWLERRTLCPLVHKLRNDYDPTTNRRYGVRGACREVARRYRKKANSLETEYRSTFKSAKS
jgi:hypothetical protein